MLSRRHPDLVKLVVRAGKVELRRGGERGAVEGGNAKLADIPAWVTEEGGDQLLCRGRKLAEARCIEAQ
jgi:hypothetical protein